MAVFTGNGSAASPSFTFSSDTNTGLYRTASDELGVSIGGTQKVNFTGTGVSFSGDPGFGVALTADSSANLTVTNQISGANTAFTLRNPLAGSTDGYGSHLEWNNQSVISRISGLMTGVGAANKFVFRLSDSSNVQADRLLLDADYLRLLSGTDGLQFNGDTAAANALDDYEEGDWTPGITAETGSFTALSVENIKSTYTKIGRIVTVQCFIRTDDYDETGASGSLIITGLPFASQSGDTRTIGSPLLMAYNSEASFTGTFAAYVAGSTTTVRFAWVDEGANAGAANFLQVDQLQTTSSPNRNWIQFSLTYQAG
jgi:hypothetical protein